jgi:hypothetical protein
MGPCGTSPTATARCVARLTARRLPRTLALVDGGSGSFRGRMHCAASLPPRVLHASSAAAADRNSSGRGTIRLTWSAWRSAPSRAIQGEDLKRTFTRVTARAGSRSAIRYLGLREASLADAAVMPDAGRVAAAAEMSGAGPRGPRRQLLSLTQPGVVVSPSSTSSAQAGRTPESCATASAMARLDAWRGIASIAQRSPGRPHARPTCTFSRAAPSQMATVVRCGRTRSSALTANSARSKRSSLNSSAAAS